MYRRLLTGLALVILSLGVAAQGAVTYSWLDADDGNTVALLRATNTYYLHALERLIRDRFPTPARADGWERLQIQAERPTTARMEYRYRIGGRDQVITYHAQSGPPIGVVADQQLNVASRGGSRTSTPSTPRTPTSPGAWTGPATPGTLESPGGSGSSSRDYSAEEPLDEPYYQGFGSDNVRATASPSVESVIEPFDVEGQARANDAEVKLLRTLERDIQLGKVPGGGRMLAWVSKATCASCQSAFETFASTYEVSGNVVQLRESLRQTELSRLTSEGVVSRDTRGIVRFVSTDRPYLANRALFEDRRAAVKDMIGSLRQQRDFTRLGSFRDRFPGRGRGRARSRNPDTHVEEDASVSRRPGC